MRHQSVALIGGSGFVGTHLANALIAAGKSVRIATRRRQRAAHLTLLPLDVIELDVFDPIELARFVEGADAVINLVGTLHGRRGTPYGPEFARLHVELPSKIAAACEGKSVHRLIHLSALNADPQGPSMYLRSKGDGEKAVRGATRLATTIFRPSVVFGPEDRFLNTFALLQRLFPVIPLAKPDARFQPVYVGDVAKAIVRALDLDAATGRIYELGGPTVYTLEALVKYCGEVIGRHARIVRLPGAFAYMQALTFEMLPGEPVLARDNLDSMMRDAIMSGPIAPELDLDPVSIEAIAPAYLGAASLRSRFNAFRTTAGR
ncbi:complex I NDUFA9 subunit family protein [Trinickia caryophylli]|uniref:NADH dehydrogenase n=1 Tax=Trinickia caryophylli TaxID=28094 RepID=A0A1X7FBA6_TRICW|nr:complex I NDUFA9 subunit family protein [Trinickia caryophylli]PMS10903.1 complex I NDUFA9 subunit family protein [Trinickia caryophylli]TRX18845.1 complex I NDUFA9 subunit family protein [Trinickia caryophylli]WQE10356.1 complex I NDUFA9 subunit family protein [Trinickia caryophylli]SMF49592.1 NADH dehydrogenase [Trinickia caryophylli]GLU34195.1 complex I NDUFA9 subunit family protein [Trinickia caryophylli]